MPKPKGPRGGSTTITPGGFIKTASYLAPELREWLVEYVHQHRHDGASLSSVIAEALDAFRESKSKPQK